MNARQELAKRHLDGETLKDAALALGISYKTAQRWMKADGVKVRPHRPERRTPTEEEDRDIRAQLDDGIPLKEIARTSPRLTYHELLNAYPQRWTKLQSSQHAAMLRRANRSIRGGV